MLTGRALVALLTLSQSPFEPHATPRPRPGARTLELRPPKPTEHDAPPVALQRLGNWRQWMGPNRDASIDVGLLPRGAEVRLAVDWKRPLGRGYSSITVVNDRAVTLVADERSAWIVALDVDDGSELWRTRMAPPPSEDTKFEQPLSTPASDGERIYAIDAAGHLLAVDGGDGDVIWSRDLATEFRAVTPSYGMTTSPLVDNGQIIVLVGSHDGPNLVAFDAATGAVRQSTAHARQGSYASPAARVIASQRQLVIPAADALYAVRADGKQLWCLAGLPFPDRDPVPLPGDRLLMAFERSAVMLQVSRTRDAFGVTQLWSTDQLSFSYSPVVHHRGALFGFESSWLASLDAASGTRLWREHIGGGSLIRIDDHLIVYGGMQGDLRVVAATTAGYREAAVVEVFGHGRFNPVPPSFAGGRVFIRGVEQVAAIRVGVSD